MRVTPLFHDRTEAGQVLAREVQRSVDGGDVLVLALPRGGVPVAYEIAQAFQAELDVVVVRKIGLPGEEELAIGAVATGGVLVLNQDLIDSLQVSRTLVEQLAARERQELEIRENRFRGNKPPPRVQGRTVILVDDGLATGASMRAAAQSIDIQQPTQIVIAVPVAAPETCREFLTYVEKIICAATPHPFVSVGSWYKHFPQISDEEVHRFLEKAVHK